MTVSIRSGGYSFKKRKSIVIVMGALQLNTCRYLTVDWERQNFSLSQCTFNEDMSQTLVPITSVDYKESSASSGGSSSGRTAGIAVGVVVGVLLVAGAIGAFFYRRHKKAQQKADDKPAEGANPKEGLISQGYAKGELGTDNEYQRFEMDAPLPGQPKPEEPQLPDWANEKANFPGHRSDMAEVEGGQVSPPELSSHQRGFPLRPLHEMQDHSAPPAELQGDHPEARELQGSNPPSATSSPGLFGRRSRRSNPGSPVSNSSSVQRRSFRDRLSSRPAPSRNATGDSVPSLESSAGAALGPSAAAPPAPAPPQRQEEPPPVGHGHSGEPFSPVSRQGTFSPDPISRQGTFSPDPISRQGTFTPENASSSVLSPVSPSSPETGRRMFGRFGLGRSGEQGR